MNGNERELQRLAGTTTRPEVSRNDNEREVRRITGAATQRGAKVVDNIPEHLKLAAAATRPEANVIGRGPKHTSLAGLSTRPGANTVERVSERKFRGSLNHERVRYAGICRVLALVHKKLNSSDRRTDNANTPTRGNRKTR